jgi:hypothetical protein
MYGSNPDETDPRLNRVAAPGCARSADIVTVEVAVAVTTAPSPSHNGTFQ